MGSMSLITQMGAMVRSLEYDKLVLYSVAATFTYFLLNAIYRITLHPLARYPGAFLQKISSWPMIIQCYNGTRHLRLLASHEKYGSIVRTGPNSLSFNTIEALQAIHSDRNANVRRDDWYKSLDISSGAYSTQSCMDKQEHLFRRRILSQAFSERALRDAEGFIMNNVKIFCDALGAGSEKAGEWTPRKNLSNWATYFGFDFISDLSFGEAFGLMKKEEPRYIPNVLMQASQFLYYLGYLPFVALIRPFLGTSLQDYIGGSAAADSLKFTKLANARLRERLQVEDQARQSGKQVRKDVFHHVLQARDPETGKGFTTGELQADSALLLAAGSDGVALTITACIFYLLHNPAVYSKVTAEIRGAFSSAEEIRTPKVNNMPYLMACIKETLRISPALPSSMPRLVLPGGLAIPNGSGSGDDSIVHIPSNTTVGVPAYAIHHNESYYPQSWSFQPERWLVSASTSTTPSSLSAANRAFCPFSTGPMDCAGKNMAYLAFKLVLAHMLWRFDVRLAATGEGEGEGDWDMSANVKYWSGLGDSTGKGDDEAKDEGRRRVVEFQMVDFIAAYRDGPIVEFREREAARDSGI